MATNELTGKCSSKKKTYCSAMDKYASVSSDSGKKIYSMQLVNTKTRTTRVAFAYQWGKKSETVFLNYCPWCGGSI